MLWLIVIILGSLAQLAIITIQQAAASGLSARRIQAYWQRELIVEHIAMQVQNLRIPRVSAPDQQVLWHPLGPPERTACAQTLRQSWTQTPCLASPNSPGPTTALRWAWQLNKVGEPQPSWPGALTQRYRLGVQATSASGHISRWQFEYEQRSLP